MDRPRFRAAADILALPLSDSQLDEFEKFEDGLYAANEMMNLTRVPREECWLRHFLDSLLFQDLIPLRASVLDIGSGPGFPAWPLAVARPDLHVTALDSSGKMVTFLQRFPLANLRTILGRAEEWRVRDQFDVVTGRAVAPLPIQLELSAPACVLEGIVVPMRTPADREAIDAFRGAGLGLRLERVDTRRLPGTDVVRLFPIFRKEMTTEDRYPRTWAEIKRSPLT